MIYFDINLIPIDLTSWWCAYVGGIIAVCVWNLREGGK